MSDSKKGSQSDLNESNMPLLDDEKTGETPEKEQIELKEGEKDDSNEKEKKKDKKKKEKKEKEKKEKGPSKIDVMTVGLDLSHRDDKAINTEIDLGFDDVLAEPDSAHGFDAIWKLSFVIFSQTKTWIYRIISAFVAIPASIIWGIIFALITVLYVWVGQPALRLFEFAVFVIKRVWTGIMRATLEPICAALGKVFNSVSVSQRSHITQNV